MKSLLNWLVFVVVWLALVCLRLLPARVARPLCHRVADLVWRLDSRHRRIGMLNLQIAFPEESSAWRTDVLRRSYRQLGDLAVELAHIPGLKRPGLVSRVLYEEGRGLENYRAAKGDGKGLLFVTAHISAWELLPAAHAARGFPLTFLVRPLDNPFLERWSRCIRHKFGNRTIDKRHAVRPVLRLLERGEDVGFLLDQNVQEREALFSPLFGKPAATSPIVAALAVRTGTPIVAGFLLPAARPGHYRIRFYPPLRARVGAPKEDEIARLTGAINARIEEVIREIPHCWLWGHRRFSTQPDGINPYS